MLLLVRGIHVVSAVVWIGGMLFIALVVVPVVRTLEDDALRTQLIWALGVRFRTVSWIALGLLILSGLINILASPFLLESPRFLWKIGLVLWSLILSVLHDFVLGPRAGAAGVDPNVRARASWVARVNVAVALVIVLLGLSLRG